MTTAEIEEHRPVCMTCRRPKSVCYCAHVRPIETQTKIVLLQHPRERDKAIGTARMASLCLPNSELHVGVEFDDASDVARVIREAEGSVALLYPGEDSQDVSLLAEGERPRTLVVVDGTWWQTRKMVRRNALLEALPRVAFTPLRPSEYRIRKEPADHCVSTIEALMYVLGALEGDLERFTGLLDPFRAMVDAQIECRHRLRAGRKRTKLRPKSLRSPFPDCFHDRPERIVCVVGEANAWPYCCPERGSLYPDELIHWVACRPFTGERFEYVVAPQHPLAQNTTKHVRLSESELSRGGDLPGLFTAFDAFLRPDDVLCSWGCYATALYCSSGGRLPEERHDLRTMSHAVEKRRFGSLEDYVTSSADPGFEARRIRGRAGLRLEKLEMLALDYWKRATAADA
ncbi:MAG: tRNA-uridine aminocarboxypropyltransferase [Polyangiaceae bacterium]